MIRLKSFYVVLWVATAMVFASLTFAQVGSDTDAVQAYLDRTITYYQRGNLPGAIAELRGIWGQPPFFFCLPTDLKVCSKPNFFIMRVTHVSDPKGMLLLIDR